MGWKDLQEYNFVCEPVNFGVKRVDFFVLHFDGFSEGVFEVFDLGFQFVNQVREGLQFCFEFCVFVV